MSVDERMHLHAITGAPTTGSCRWPTAGLMVPWIRLNLPPLLIVRTVHLLVGMLAAVLFHRLGLQAGTPPCGPRRSQRATAARGRPRKDGTPLHHRRS
jgi:hypothetical protein